MDSGKRSLPIVAHLHQLRSGFGFASLERCVSGGGPQSCTMLDVAALTDTDAKKQIERLCGVRNRILVCNAFLH